MGVQDTWCVHQGPGRKHSSNGKTLVWAGLGDHTSDAGEARDLPQRTVCHPWGQRGDCTQVTAGTVQEGAAIVMGQSYNQRQDVKQGAGGRNTPASLSFCPLI